MKYLILNIVDRGSVIVTRSWKFTNSWTRTNFTFLRHIVRSPSTTGKKDGRVSCIGRVGDLVPLGIMEAQDLEPAEITPVVVEVPKPIVDYAIDRCAQVQLVAQGVELNSEVDILQQ